MGFCPQTLRGLHDKITDKKNLHALYHRHGE